MVGLVSLLLSASVALATTSSHLVHRSEPVTVTNCNGREYIYQGMYGFGSVAANFTDKYGDSISFGSAAAAVPESWRLLENGTYTGTLYMLADRGWNTNGTVNFASRVYVFDIWFTPLADDAPTPAAQNLIFGYKDSILLKDPKGNLGTGLDSNYVLNFTGFPPMAASKYPGDGWGGPGPGNIAVSLDCEGILYNEDGSFWISDEYSPYVYHFDPSGKMIDVLAPPAAIVPHRNGSDSFSADSPPMYYPDWTTVPADPDTGRVNNQGFEGLAADPSRDNIYALLQSATVQDDGDASTKRRWTRLFKWTKQANGKYEYVDAWALGLPTYTTLKNTTGVAAQSELHYLFDDQFLVLPRDSNGGHCQASNTSLYRHIDIYDISNATSIHTPVFDAVNGTIAPKGALLPSITPALYCSFIDFNNNEQLGKFGLHNGNPNNANLLNEKWEGMAVVPADGKDGADGWYYIIATNDNDFVTQDGHMDFGRITYADATGCDYNSEALVFKVKLPQGARPFK